jgi:hypothetical protein
VTYRREGNDHLLAQLSHNLPINMHSLIASAVNTGSMDKHIRLAPHPTDNLLPSSSRKCAIRSAASRRPILIKCSTTIASS